ncbi:MAG: prenyltransferase/squalene oxidase repeat-containing protein [Anaerolineales bacterium]
MSRVSHCVRNVFLVLVVLFALSGFTEAGRKSSRLTATPPARQTEAVDAALDYIRTQQQANGSFGSDVGITLDAILAGAAAGENVSRWRTAVGNPSPLDYLAAHGGGYAEDAAKTGKMVVGLVAADHDPRDFGGEDFVQRLVDFGQGGAGILGESATEQVWGILGLAAAEAPITQEMVDVLIGLQQPDGGWEFAPDLGMDSNTTALALQALVAAGVEVDDPPITEGLGYLATQQTASGGFVYSIDWGSEADANSTAYCLQALIATGEDPASEEWLVDGNSPLDALLSFQGGNGAFEWQSGEGENLLATAQAVPALLGKTLPFPGTVPAIEDAVAYVRDLHETDKFPVDSSPQAVMALVAVGENPRLWVDTEGDSLVDYLERAAKSSENVGQTGRVAAALAMAGGNPYAVGDLDLISEIQSVYDEETGAYDANGSVWNHGLAIWGLTAVGENVPAQAVTWLKDQQNVDGGWGWGAGVTSDSNSTALVVETLIVCGVDRKDAAIQGALSYLASTQAPDGGFLYDESASMSDGDSTAITMQALLAAGEDPASGWEWAQTLTGTEQITMTVHKPKDRLFSLQTPSGAFKWMPDQEGNLWTTLAAMPALAGQPFPWRREVIYFPLVCNSATPAQ